MKKMLFTLTVLASAFCAMTFTACGDKAPEQKPADQNQAKEEVKDAGEKAADAVTEGADKAAEAVEKAADKAE